MPLRTLICFVSFCLFGGQVGGQVQKHATSELEARMEASPVLALTGEHLAAQPPTQCVGVWGGR